MVLEPFCSEESLVYHESLTSFILNMFLLLSLVIDIFKQAATENFILSYLSTRNRLPNPKELLNDIRDTKIPAVFLVFGPQLKSIFSPTSAKF